MRQAARIRTLGLLSVLLPVAAGCSSGAGTTSGSSAESPGTSIIGTPSTIKGGPQPSGALPKGVAASGGSASGPGPRQAGPAPGAPPAAAAGQPEPGPDEGALSGPGGYARTILRPQPANHLTLQVIEQSGATPNQTAVNNVVAMLGKVSGKGVSLAGPVVFGSTTTQWTPTELAAAVQAHGTTNITGATNAVVHLLVLRGTFQGDQSVLGAAFLGDSFAIFPDQTNGSFTLNSDRTATAIYIHETGHLLGLVDEVLDDHRADPNDPSHCSCHSSDPNSVMYYALDTTAIGQLLNGGPPVDFDATDYNDLARLRAGA